jgi:hypothetical protein
MRGDERIQIGMFSYVSLEQRVPLDHPLRAVCKLTDAVLQTLNPEFDALYADWTSIDCAGVHSVGAFIAGALLPAFGAVAGRADRNGCRPRERVSEARKLLLTQATNAFQTDFGLEEMNTTRIETSIRGVSTSS